MESGSLKQLLRYEQELKGIIQEMQNLILEGDRRKGSQVRALAEEQDRLIRYLEVESSNLTAESKLIYTKQLSRFKRKAKQHKEYIQMFHGNQAVPQSPFLPLMQQQQQNANLMQNKMMMEENRLIQNQMGNQLLQQGDVIQGGIDRNKAIRGQAQESETAIKLIERSIMKRKLMFGSLLVAFAVSVIIVLIVKISKG